jgi:hypothetical protein
MTTWSDLPFCNGAWDVDLRPDNTFQAHCSHPFDVKPYLLTFLALAILAVYLLLKRSTMQAKFTVSFPIAPAQIQAADLTFPDAVGQPISGSLQLSGGTPPYTVAVADPSTLPPGVSIDAAGNVSGTQTAAGTFSVPVTVTDSGA